MDEQLWQEIIGNLSDQPLTELHDAMLAVAVNHSTDIPTDFRELASLIEGEMQIRKLPIKPIFYGG